MLGPANARTDTIDARLCAVRGHRSGAYTSALKIGVGLPSTQDLFMIEYEAPDTIRVLGKKLLDEAVFAPLHRRCLIRGIVAVSVRTKSVKGVAVELAQRQAKLDPPRQIGIGYEVASEGHQSCVTITCAPADASANAVARPIPRDLPVTRAVFLLKPVTKTLLALEVSGAESSSSRPLGSADRSAQPADFPPSTFRMWPVMKLAASDVMNRMARATSSGWPIRFCGFNVAR